MLRPFVSTHSKVAELQVIRTFAAAPIHFRCDCVDAFPVQIEGPEQTRLIEAHQIEMLATFDSDQVKYGSLMPGMREKTTN